MSERWNEPWAYVAGYRIGWLARIVTFAALSIAASPHWSALAFGVAATIALVMWTADGFRRAAAANVAGAKAAEPLCEVCSRPPVVRNRLELEELRRWCWRSVLDNCAAPFPAPAPGKGPRQMETRKQPLQTTPRLYRKRPLVVTAYQTPAPMVIDTLEGQMRAEVGDWIIRGVNGERYPCKPDIFEKTYEPAPEGEPPSHEF